MQLKDENEIYELAYAVCNKVISKSIGENINENVTACINETVERFSDMIKNPKGLKDYLYSRVSREKEEEEASILLGEEAERSTWWKEYRENNNHKLKFWDRYNDYLFREKHWEKSSIKKSIDNTTDTLLNSLAKPQMEQEKRAMVVGYVQSGKTANYIALINKAIDAGYKYIIVLAGLHNNLRSQTQARIDEEVLGYETDSQERQRQRDRSEKNKIGVGKIYNAGFVQTLTFRDENGDFTKSRAGFTLSPENPTIIVTKKIKSTLENLINNIKSNNAISEKDGNLFMSAKYPLLLIDDEADQASVNTGYDYDENGVVEDEYDVKTINKLIRRLFNHFQCRSYVGYTATPYANIFIPNDLKIANEDLGTDLFPADCIVGLPKPYFYIGANEFFGYGEDYKELEPMPLRRKISESSFINVKAKIVRELPDSLKTAIKSFLLTVAIRNCRGERNKPNTMLIHVTRLNNLQGMVERKVKNYFFDQLQNMIIDGDNQTKEDFYELYIKDYITTTNTMNKNFSKYMVGVRENDFESIYNEIIRLMSDERVEVSTINGSSKDFLAYKLHENKEYNVIAIGGDKFSRGLTLEGLSVSYFTREAKYYDTLMQMGRWFGFRPKYTDLCRLYVTDDIYRWFARISFATDNLMEQIKYCCEEESSPEKFGFRIATHPEIKISNPQKIKTGLIQKLDFGNTTTIMRDIDVDIKQYKHNFEAVQSLIVSSNIIVTSEEHFSKLKRKPVGKHYFLENVPGMRIVQFMREFHTSKYANKVAGVNIASYIELQLEDNFLVDWTVAIINVGPKEKGIEIGGINVGPGITRYVDFYEDKKVCSVKMLKSNDHELFSLNKSDLESAMDIRRVEKENGKKDASEKIREKMDNKKGLLVIYPIDFNSKEKETKYFKIGDGNHKPPFGLVMVFPKGNGKAVSFHLNPIATKENNYVLFD